MKTKYILQIIAMLSLAIISFLHPEKYHIIMPIFFLVMASIGFYLAFNDKKPHK